MHEITGLFPTPFLRAAQSSDLALMKLLLAHGADPKIMTQDKITALDVASGLGWGVGFSAITVFVYQGAITLTAGLFDTILAEGSEALAALTSAGGLLIIGIALKLLDVTDVKVGNFLPALVFAPCLVGLVSLVR